MTVGVIGIGGLGTMGIKLAKALGHRVVAISTTPAKEAMAKEKGADAFVVSKDPESMKTETANIDLLLNTVSAAHQCSMYFPLISQGGVLVQLGVIAEPQHINQMMLVGQRKGVAGSLVGGIANTEEMLALCAQHQIFPDCEMVEAKQIDWVWDQLATSNKDGVRYVIDVKKSLADPEFVAK